MEKDQANSTGDKEGYSSTATTPASPTISVVGVESPGVAAETPPTTQPGPGASRSSWIQRWSDAIPVISFLVLVVVLEKLAIALVNLIYPLPYPTRMYLGLSAVAAMLVLTGLLFLIILIPAGSKFLKSELRTELYSVRSSSQCVIAGLIVFGIVAIGLVLAQVLQTVR